jgi:hypothetical protein
VAHSGATGTSPVGTGGHRRFLATWPTTWPRGARPRAATRTTAEAVPNRAACKSVASLGGRHVRLERTATGTSARPRVQFLTSLANKLPASPSFPLSFALSTPGSAPWGTRHECCLSSPPPGPWNRDDLAAATGGWIMLWADRNKGLGRIVLRLSAGTALGLVPAGLYGGLAAAVHFVVTGHWDRSPAFALGCAVVGAGLGLLAGGVWALSEQGPAPDSRRRTPWRRHGPALARPLTEKGASPGGPPRGHDPAAAARRPPRRTRHGGPGHPARARGRRCRRDLF